MLRNANSDIRANFMHTHADFYEPWQRLVHQNYLWYQSAYRYGRFKLSGMRQSLKTCRTTATSMLANVRKLTNDMSKHNLIKGTFNHIKTQKSSTHVPKLAHNTNAERSTKIVTHTIEPAWREVLRFTAYDEALKLTVDVGTPRFQKETRKDNPPQVSCVRDACPFESSMRSMRSMRGGFMSERQWVSQRDGVWVLLCEEESMCVCVCLHAL
jgi:hypothetical protein